MPIVTSTIAVTTNGGSTHTGDTRRPEMLLVDNVAEAMSTVFQVQMGSPMLLEQFGMEPGGHVDIVSVTYSSDPQTIVGDGVSEYGMASLTQLESNGHCLFLSPFRPRALLTMPGHYRLLVRSPTVLGSFSVRSSWLTPAVAELFDPHAGASAPQALVMSATGTLEMNIPSCCTAQVTALLPQDTVLSAQVLFNGVYTSAVDAEGCCLCASNVDTVPSALGTFTLGPGSYLLDTLPPRPNLAVVVNYTCS